MANTFDFKTLDTGFEADWPVAVKAPIDGGAVEVQTFMARFRTPTPTEQAEIDAAGKDPALDQFKIALKIGFVGLAKSEGETLTEAMFDKMWATSNVQLALIRAYSDFRSGSPAKN